MADPVDPAKTAADPATPKDPPAAPPAATEEPKTALGADPADPAKNDPAKEPAKADPAKEPAKSDPPPEPAKIELKLPEGVQIPAQVLEGFTRLAGELKLDSAAAQKLLDFELSIGQQAVKDDQAARVEWIKNLGEEARSDKEIGGSNWDATMADAGKALAQFGSKELRAMLNSTGLGNHKEMIRFVAKVGKALAEDKMPDVDPSAPGGKKTAAQLLYDHPSSQNLK